MLFNKVSYYYVFYFFKLNNANGQGATVVTCNRSNWHPFFKPTFLFENVRKQIIDKQNLESLVISNIIEINKFQHDEFLEYKK